MLGLVVVLAWVSSPKVCLVYLLHYGNLIWTKSSLGIIRLNPPPPLNAITYQAMSNMRVYVPMCAVGTFPLSSKLQRIMARRLHLFYQTHLKALVGIEESLRKCMHICSYLFSV